MLIELVEGRQPEERQVIFPTEIIERGSIRSIPESKHENDREIN
jgi:DNA-binding LacI/PurR family transcriptional regulator